LICCHELRPLKEQRFHSDNYINTALQTRRKRGYYLLQGSREVTETGLVGHLGKRHHKLIKTMADLTINPVTTGSAHIAPVESLTVLDLASENLDRSEELGQRVIMDIKGISENNDQIHIPEPVNPDQENIPGKLGRDNEPESIETGKEGATNIPASVPLLIKPEGKAVDTKRTHRIFMTGKELFNLSVKAEPFLLERIIPREVLMVLSGDSDSGKSLWALNFAVHIVTGAEYFIGLKVQVKHNAALIVSTEDGIKDLALRVQKLVQTFEEENLCENLHFCFASGEKTKNKIAEFLAKTPVDVVIVDVATDIFKGNSNDVSDVRLFFNDYKMLIEKYGCTMLFLHHTRKGSGKEAANKDQTLGSQAWTAAPRGLLMLKKELNPFDDNARTLWLSKGNFAPESVKNTPVYMTFESETLRFTESQLSTRNLNEDPPGSFTKRNDPKNINAVLELRNKGLTLAGIVEELNKNGVDIKKTTVSEIINDNKKDEIKLDDPTNLLG